MSLADSIRRRTDEWVERKRQEARARGLMEGREEGRREGRAEARAELVREFLAARREGRLDELLAAYGCPPSGYETQRLENRG